MMVPIPPPLDAAMDQALPPINIQKEVPLITDAAQKEQPSCTSLDCSNVFIENSSDIVPYGAVPPEVLAKKLQAAYDDLPLVQRSLPPVQPVALPQSLPTTNPMLQRIQEEHYGPPRPRSSSTAVMPTSTLTTLATPAMRPSSANLLGSSTSVETTKIAEVSQSQARASQYLLLPKMQGNRPHRRTMSDTSAVMDASPFARLAQHVSESPSPLMVNKMTPEERERLFKPLDFLRILAVTAHIWQMQSVNEVTVRNLLKMNGNDQNTKTFDPKRVQKVAMRKIASDVPLGVRECAWGVRLRQLSWVEFPEESSLFTKAEKQCRKKLKRAGVAKPTDEQVFLQAIDTLGYMPRLVGEREEAYWREMWGELETEERLQHEVATLKAHQKQKYLEEMRAETGLYSHDGDDERPMRPTIVDRSDLFRLDNEKETGDSTASSRRSSNDSTTQQISPVPPPRRQRRSNASDVTEIMEKTEAPKDTFVDAPRLEEVDVTEDTEHESTSGAEDSDDDKVLAPQIDRSLPPTPMVKKAPTALPLPPSTLSPTMNRASPQVPVRRQLPSPLPAPRVHVSKENDTLPESPSTAAARKAHQKIVLKVHLPSRRVTLAVSRATTVATLMRCLTKRDMIPEWDEKQMYGFRGVETDEAGELLHVEETVLINDMTVVPNALFASYEVVLIELGPRPAA